MSLRNLLWFYRRRLGARLVQEALALLGIAVGVGLLFAVQVANHSLSASIAELTDGLVGDAQLQLVARGPQGFDSALLRRVEQSRGVEAVAPMLVMQANAVGAGGARSIHLLAADQRLARLGGSLLRGYRADRLGGLRGVVLPLSLAEALGVRFGDTLALQLRGRTVRVPVATVLSARDVGALADSPVAFLPLAYAQALTGMEGRISRAYVVAEPGRASLAEASLRTIAAGRLNVAGTDYDRRLFAQAALPNDQSTALFASISALVGFLLAFNAMLLMARERRGLIAELRMSGHSAAVVVQVLLFDALVLGIAASLCGIALGDVLSRYIFEPDPGYLAIAFPVGVARSVPLDIVLLAFGAGIAAAVLATLRPLLAAFKAPALDAVDDDSLVRGGARRPFASPLWAVAGCVCLGVTTFILLAAPEAARFGMATLVGAMLLLLPTFLAGALNLLDRLRRRVSGVALSIAVGELRSSGSRSAAIAAIAAIAVFGSTAIESSHRDLQRALDTASHQLNAGTDLWVSAAGAANSLATAPFPPGVLATIAVRPEVASVAIYRATLLDVGDRRIWVMGPPPGSTGAIPTSELVEGNRSRATAQIARGGWAAVSEVLAEERDLSIGDAFTLPSPHPTRFRVAAITTNYGWSPGAIVVNANDFERAWGSDDAGALQVRLADVGPVEGKRIVEAALGAESALTVDTAAEREQRHQQTTRAGLARLTQIATMMLMAAVLAIAAAMSGLIWQRRRRMADLKLAGIHHRDLWRALMLESAILLGVGSTVGAVFGLYGAQLLDRALKAVTGFPVNASLGVWVALMCFALVAAATSAIVMLPGYLAARVPVEAAFQE